MLVYRASFGRRRKFDLGLWGGELYVNDVGGLESGFGIR